SVGGAVDNLTYHYVSPTNNQLAWVEDPIDAAGIDDLEGQAAGNYTYTAIGELYSDASEDIESIDWKVTGKIKRINRENSSTQPEVEFVYDAMGNRIAKIEYTSTGDLIDKTFYSLDAQGNVMAIYTLEIDNPNKNLYLSERNIYGSSRVGVERVDQIIVSTVASNININSENTASVVVQKTGDKRYELSNHLGNVLEVVTDRKLRKSNGYQFDLSTITTGSICVSANVWTPEVGGTTFTTLDYNFDGTADLQVTNPSSVYSGMLTIATVPGQVYTVNYEVLSQTVSYINAVAYACPGGLITPNTITTAPGVYSYTFTATSTLSRLKWIGSNAGNYILSNITIQGAGDPSNGTGDAVIDF
ncbi:MAG: hypothetical protein JNJ99_10605, partial [Crocinitomicaceae bacterium]|nr:hypothetical protein [Crocinitomicaceae bacterium]